MTGPIVAIGGVALLHLASARAEKDRSNRWRHELRFANVVRWDNGVPLAWTSDKPVLPWLRAEALTSM